ncbi:uncharacterized protein LOC124158817 [Ischnura elegans]|uniref:uncharacterized protein LOC124158817 n=1 Tax=Ischnura elegans TaxID=197161 RepID=UPI001ED8A6A1|nr:uncharacterized protein LOC124158817 [Ischnura elegans]XP_046390126.1 uncharacterized protein LOC124158817 [Ischnura elegans]XP_046390135.1 uncharacterized protein LOC124158817 [Ischnura elegans]
MSDSGSSSDSSEPEVVIPSTRKRGRANSRNSRASSSKPSQSNTLSSVEWSEAEKMQLAVGLQQYGHKDVENLHKVVPTKSCEQIKAYTYWVIKKARLWYCNDTEPGEKLPAKAKTYTRAPIDQWLYSFEKAHFTNSDEFRDCLSKAFLYISRYEPHPDPKDCNGVDYAAMYEFLYLALNGYPVKALSPETASAVLKSLDELSDKIREYGTDEEQQFLTKVKRIVYVENATKRHYGKKKKDGDEGPMKSLMDIKGFNPLNIPYEMLKTRPNKHGSSQSGSSKK